MSLSTVPYQADKENLPGDNPRWGEVLQRPNLNSDLGGSARAKAIWLARQNQQGSSSSLALVELAAALKAARDKQLADLAAADALRAAGRGGGRSGGGSGGKAPAPMFAPLQDSYDPWIDDYLASIGSQSAPSSTGVFGVGPKTSRPSTAHVAPRPKVKGRGAAAANRPKPKKPSRSRVILS